MIHILLNTSVLLQDQTEDSEIEDEKKYLPLIFNIFLAIEYLVIIYVSTPILKEYKIWPAFLKKRPRKLHSFEHALLRNLVRIKFSRPNRNIRITKNINLRCIREHSWSLFDECVHLTFRSLVLDENDEKFIQIFMFCNHRGNELWFITLDRKISNQEFQIIRSLVEKCKTENQGHIVSPSTFYECFRSQGSG